MRLQISDAQSDEILKRKFVPYILSYFYTTSDVGKSMHHILQEISHTEDNILYYI
jgi:hypothetical protein